jgi:hypothetical protein
VGTLIGALEKLMAAGGTNAVSHGKSGKSGRVDKVFPRVAAPGRDSWFAWDFAWAPLWSDASEWLTLIKN